MSTHKPIIIIGAGFAGIGLGLKLKDKGWDDFLILEAEAGVGGTWWVNRYPGCACDVQSHLYSLSFAPNPDWTRHFPSREEIQAHLERVVDDKKLTDHILLNTRVTEARWDDPHKQWSLTTSTGDQFTCQVLIGALGGLSKPAKPNIEGLESFQGRMVHSQAWPEDLDLTAQHVTVIGTGASAIQFLPHVARQAKSLTVFQRTPNWVLPKPDRPIPLGLRKAYRYFPPLRYLTRLGLFLVLETRLPAFTRWPKLSFFHRRKALRHLHSQVHDPKLIEQLTPHYQMGCKRVLMSNDYYPIFNHAHVNLVTAPIEAIEHDGLQDRDGVRYRADVLILGTGFEATSPIPKGMIFGKRGQDLAERWREGPEAYKGSTVSGFPNFFMLMGPNTALGHNSVLLMIEGQIHYIIDALSIMKKRGWRSVELTKPAQTAWSALLDKTLENSVWNAGGCSSWYLHPISGRNTTLWPYTTIRFKRLTRRFDSSAYRCE